MSTISATPPIATRMTQARAEVRKATPKDNFLVVTIDAKVVLPYKAGIALVEALQGAHVLPRYSSEGTGIKPIDSQLIQMTPMSASLYELHQMAALMGVKVSDLEDAMLQQQGVPF